MFGIGGFELFIILLFGFLVFGPDKLPEIARTVGAALRKFKQAQEEMEAVLKDEVLETEKPPRKKQASSGVRSGAKPQPKSQSKAQPQSSSSSASQETFAQRKARFDQERLKKQEEQKAQHIEANRRAMKDAAAQKSTQSQGISADQTSEPAMPALTPDELFGLKPVGVPRSSSAAELTSRAGSAVAAKAVVGVEPAVAAEPLPLERGDN